MSFVNLVLAKFRSAERFLNEYAKLYWYEADLYMVDEGSVPVISDDYGLYLDYVVTKFRSLPKVTIPVRFVELESDLEENELGAILTTGFSLGVLDSVLREKKVSLRVGDVIATARVFDELAELKSFEQFTKPAFVRVVQSIVPRTLMIGLMNVVEWVIRVSDTDVVFRYYV